MTSNVRDNLILDSETNEFVPRKTASDNFADIIVPKTKANNNFKKNNKDLLETIDKKYEQIQDAELREKFDSNDQNVVAAVAIACQRAKAKTFTQEISDTFKTQAVLDAEFAEHYEQALDDIENGPIHAKSPNSYRNDEALKKLDKKKAEKKKIKKNNRTRKNGHIIKCVEECEDKNCEITRLKLYITAKQSKKEKKEIKKAQESQKVVDEQNDQDDYYDMFIDTGARTDAIKINEALTKSIEKYEKERASEEILIDDIFLPNNEKEEYHLVGGRLSQFQTNIRIDVAGKCGHSKPTKCPQIEVSTNRSTTLKALDVLPFAVKEHTLENNDDSLQCLRLNPDSPVKGLGKDIKKFVLSRISPEKRSLERATYTLNLTSCKDKPYKDFSPKLIIHPKVVLTLSISIKFDLEKNSLVPTFSYKRKNDTEFSKFTFDLSKNLLQEGLRIIKEFIGNGSMILNTLMFLVDLYQKFATLGKTDGTDDTPTLHDQPSENDNDEAKPKEITTEEEKPEAQKAEEKAPEKEKEGKDAAFLPPQINLSYKRSTANLPSQGFNEIGHDQTIYISGSPLLKFEKEIEILNFLWLKSFELTRKITSKMTFGGSEAVLRGCSKIASWATDKLELDEGNERALSKFYALAKTTLARNHIEAQENIEIMASLESAPTEQEQPNPEPFTDQQVNDVVAKPVSTSHNRVQCVVKFSASAETDDPDAGILWEKPAGAKKFTYSETNMYIGFNASAQGELSATNQILKTRGYASSAEQEQAITQAGAITTLTSADKTGESRAGLTLGYLPQGKNFPQTPERKPFITKNMKPKKVAAEIARTEEKKKEDILAKEGFYGQWFYSGLNIEIVGYIWHNRSAVEGDPDEAKKAILATAGSARNTGQVKVKIEGDAPGDKPKTKTFIDFCIFKARESEKKKVSQLFSILPPEPDD